MREIPRDKTVLYEPDIKRKLNDMLKQRVFTQFNDRAFNEEVDFSECGSILKQFFDESKSDVRSALPSTPPFAAPLHRQEAKSPTEDTAPVAAGRLCEMLVGEFKIDWSLAHSYEDKIAELWQRASEPPAEDMELSDFVRRERFYDGVLDYTGGVIKLARDKQLNVPAQDEAAIVRRCVDNPTPPLEFDPLPPPPPFPRVYPRLFRDVVSAGGGPVPLTQPVSAAQPLQAARLLQAARPVPVGQHAMLSGFLQEPPLVACEPVPEPVLARVEAHRRDDVEEGEYVEINMSDFTLSGSASTIASVVSLPMTITGSASSFRMPPAWVSGNDNPFFTCIMRSKRTDLLMHKVLNRMALLYMAGSGHLFEAFRSVEDKRHFYRDIWLQAHLSLLKKHSDFSSMAPVKRIKDMLVDCCKRPRGAERDRFIVENQDVFAEFERKMEIPNQQRLQHYFRYYIDHVWATLAAKMTDDKVDFLKRVEIFCGITIEDGHKGSNLIFATKERVIAWADEFMRAADTEQAVDGSTWLNANNLNCVRALASVVVVEPQSGLGLFFRFT
ncbi:MAG: hypothetical protein P1U40_12160 [Coxiellaceae bacterium]|nr:hypothetical protein [Coxiellaceae bacterium]